MKTTSPLRPEGSAAAGIPTPFGRISNRPGMKGSAARRATSDTAIRWSTRRSTIPQHRFPIGHQRLPDACEVVTTGHGAVAMANADRIGAYGSWTWTTSKRSVRQSRRSRVIACGERTMFGSVPFAGTITERPTGTT